MGIKKFIQILFRYRSYKKAIKEAKRLRSENFKKHLVIFWGGEFRAIAKQNLKLMHSNKIFKSSIKYKDLERMSYFTTK